uniref:Uncharacterized protein n=1 Tax=Glossina palpalis gambiensis TaxID=67801 RepID=A0A1B0B7E4_9MUSC
MELSNNILKQQQKQRLQHHLHSNLFRTIQVGRHNWWRWRAYKMACQLCLLRLILIAAEVSNPQLGCDCNNSTTSEEVTRQ